MAITTLPSAVEHFDAAEFDQFLADHGTPALWRKATACPCRDPRTGHVEIDCPYCDHGLGILWDAGSPITVLAPGRQRRDDYDQTGAWMQGMVMLTFPSTLTPGHLDLIELMAAVMVVDNERLVRGAVDRLGRSQERVRLPHPLALERCAAVVGGALVDYKPDTDVFVDWAGTVHWYGASPPDQTPYTLRYTARPSYVVWSPQSRDEAGATMPFRAMSQRLDFFDRPVVEAA